MGCDPRHSQLRGKCALGLMQEAGFLFILLDLTTLSQLSRHERDAVDEQFGALFDADRLRSPVSRSTSNVARRRSGPWSAV